MAHTFMPRLVLRFCIVVPISIGQFQSQNFYVTVVVLYLQHPLQEKKEGLPMARYGKKASSKVEKVMHERKHGTLRSGSSGKKVTSRKQAIAIGLSEARRSGAKVPARKK